MASKRKRKMMMKAAQAESAKMAARRETFNDNLWKFGLPICVALILILVVYFGFFYTIGPANAEGWELEEAETGTIYKSSDYYSNGKLTLVEFFHTECSHCQQQTGPLKEIYSNYSTEIYMFSIGGYKLGSNTDGKSDIASFKFKYSLNLDSVHDLIEKAVSETLNAGFRTKDIGHDNTFTCSEMDDEILSNIVKLS